MARYVSTTVMCEKCYKVEEIDFSSEELVDKELEELGWNFETGEDICPNCWDKIIEEETEQTESGNG